ncbi:heme/hemin ABC transporter substrate-binding protein [Nocardia sp. CA-107356]|uniref:heme/hemin ABC transporter substrate-binding protein n=1 Tax=Nocardia sp. CA-107356 TaxID=3239972 RepID=UPI003D9089EF
MFNCGRVGILILGLAVTLGLGACSATAPNDVVSHGNITAKLTDLDPQPVTSDPHPTLPVTVRSFDGTDVTVSDAGRIIAVDRFGTLAQTVYALGLGSHLIGRSTSAKLPAIIDRPDVTPSGESMSIEAVLALRPTVLLTDTTTGTPAQFEQLRAAGVPIVFFDPTRTLNSTGPQIQAIADALGIHDQGVALAQRTTSEIAAATAAVPTANPKVRIAFVYLRGTALTMLAGPGSGADALITGLGGEDAGTAAGLTEPFVTITSEALIAARPDILLVMTDGLASIGGTDGLLRLPGIAQTPAGRTGRIIDMSDSVLLGFGPNTGRVLAALRAVVYR